ncbi:MAG: 50S ribosomal protein L29 [Candidatus Woesebacteria bacterium]
MKINDKKVLREKSVIDLQKQVDALRKEMTVSKLQFGVGKLAKVHMLKNLRVHIAIAKTIISEKERAQA